MKTLELFDRNNKSPQNRPQLHFAPVVSQVVSTVTGVIDRLLTSMMIQPGSEPDQVLMVYGSTMKIKRGDGVPRCPKYFVAVLYMCVTCMCTYMCCCYTVCLWTWVIYKFVLIY